MHTDDNDEKYMVFSCCSKFGRQSLWSQPANL